MHTSSSASTEARAGIRSAAAAFLRPRRQDGVPPGMAFVPAAHSGAALNFWECGAGETVVLVHGWEGSPADLGGFVPPLLRSGFRVVAVELPAHARSDAAWTSVPHAAEALARFGRHLGAARAVIGRSVGGAVSALALSQGMPVSCAVLLAAPAAYIDYAKAFGAALGLDAAGVGEMLAVLRQDWQIDVASVSTPAAAAGLSMPALLVHSDDDRVVPLQDARRIHDAWAGSRLLEVRGLGHRRLLADPVVIDAGVDFVARAPAARR